MSAVPFPKVLEDELEQIHASRNVRFADHLPGAAPEASLIGLAFSGGGIRSATFNLGVLQALAKEKLLHCFDYLSSVSGGGYIASWLMGWMHHQRIGVAEIEKVLSPRAANSATTAEPPEVRFLRSYSNYLTPRKGLLKADFWAFVASYVRNALLNQLILVPFLLSLLLLPRAIVYVPHWFDRFDNAPLALAWMGVETLRSQYLALTVGVACGLIGVISMGLNLCWIEVPKDRKPSRIAKPAAIHFLIVLPLFLAAALIGYGLDQIFRFDLDADELLEWAIFAGLGLYFLVWVAACLVRWVARRLFWRDCRSGPPSWIILLSAFAAGAISGLLFLPYAQVVNASTPAAGTGSLLALWRMLTFGTPAFAGVILVAGALHIGLMGRQFGDAYREWWARLGGWLMIYAVSWLLLFITALYVPYWIGGAYDRYHLRVTVGSAFLWVASTLYGVLFGKNSATGSLKPDDPLRRKILAWGARATPYVFIAGLLALLSILAGWIAAALSGQEFHLSKPAEYVSPVILYLWLVFLAVAMFLSWRVDINAFSCHMLYRNRLVRCYLGASVKDRNSQPFTGFSADDDAPLAALKIPKGSQPAAVHGRPIPILNASLNVTRGKELALQTRKARSFVLSPAHSGYARPLPETSTWQSIYADTALAGSKKPDTKHGITLGTAVAISGAAASPNMGSYSDAALAFLMTIFDVRLGWWLGNPQNDAQWKRGGPQVALVSLLKELFGAASDDSSYVYLSDGGHFENLAIYELVRRRCKLIVACDASCDSEYRFTDLHNAMERCRVDFGVEIELDTKALKRDRQGLREHFAVGKIHYTPGDSRDDGVLIYLKPVLRRGEPNPDPADLLAYELTNKQFPHDTTANQWFDENHFENYRNLGYVSGLAAAAKIRKAADSLLD